MRQRRDGGQAPRRAPSRPLPLPLNLIHTTNCSKPSGTGASGRLVITLQDPEGLPLGDAFKLLRGDLSPLGYLFLRRAVHAGTKTT